jgi:flagellar hook-basal body complex protein FliE
MSNTITPDTLLAQMRAMIEQAQGQGVKPPVEQSTQGGFSDLLKNAVNSVNDNQQEANKLATAFQNPDSGVQMSEVMVALQKANVSFQAMVEVRNKLVGAYQEIMNMQV